MSLLLPRLDRESARTMLARARDLRIETIASGMPDRAVVVTYSPVGGARARDAQLEALREEIVGLACEHGYPGDPERVALLEARMAAALHQALPMTPNEASYEDVWSYLTCNWLLDVAFWRFGHGADERRFIGNVNRNTFRRLWWRTETLGDVPLERLGEDELVNIMERPTIAGDRRLARTIATEFLQRVAADDAAERMQLMREAMKHILRLTPFVSFAALNEAELQAVVVATFDAAAAGLAGLPTPTPVPPPARLPSPSPVVTSVERTVVAAVNGAEAERGPSPSAAADSALAAQIAVDIARKTGRVTNMMLREVLRMSQDEAREVLQQLVTSGQLQRRGVKRGTHYVLPDRRDESLAPASTPGSPRHPAPQPPARRETALRRLLRRDR